MPKVTMFNISKGKNKQLMEKCGPLYEYSWFVDMCNEYHLAGAVDEEIVNNVLKGNAGYIRN